MIYELKEKYYPHFGLYIYNLFSAYLNRVDLEHDAWVRCLLHWFFYPFPFDTYHDNCLLADNRDDIANGLMWLRGGSGEQGLHSLNLQSFGSFPWVQQRLDLSFPGNDHTHQYQAMLASGFQNLGSGDPLRQQFQQPLQYVQQPGDHNLLLQLQRAVSQSVPHNIVQAPSQLLSENFHPVLGREQVANQRDDQTQQQHNMIQSDQLQQRQPANAPSSFLKADIVDSAKFSGAVPPLQNMLSSLCPDSNSNLFNFSSTGQSMLADQLPQQSWAPKYSHAEVNAFSSSTSRPPVFPGKDAIIEPEIGNSNARDSALFGVNNDSYGLLLPTTMPGFATPSNEADVPSIPLGDPSFQNPLYGCMQDSSELQSTGQVDPSTPSRTFVKVYEMLFVKAIFILIIICPRLQS